MVIYFLLMKECHQEEIHLCGKIQSHGYLIVFANDFCIATSENSLKLLKQPLNNILGKGLPEILQLLAPNLALDIDKIYRKISVAHCRYSEKILLMDREYDLTFFFEDQKTFLEIEPCDGHVKNIGRIYEYARHLQAYREKIWVTLCDLIRDIIGFDRIAVYRFNKDKTGQVIAENKVENIDSILGFHYPEFDIPAQARALYLRFRARHVADINAPTIDILGIDPDQLDLGKCSLRALSPIHLKYLRNAGVSASASFSIILNDQLWGLVVCQNKIAKNVDLTQRYVSELLIEYAINYYFADYQRRKIQKRTLVTDVEKQMLARLMENLDEEATIEEFASKIMKTVKADGILIRRNDGMISFGEVPDHREQLLLEKYIETNQFAEMFSTDQFEPSENQESAIEFPGIIRINILPAKGWFICMYRKEQVKEIVWAGRPEKIVNDAGQKVDFPSPRTSFQAWRKSGPRLFDRTWNCRAITN
ncbi:Bacteriophytochrome [Sphingobacterium multivorum]|nr:Bacteriophytochrome [Sphingobacterium multivorum]